MEINKQQLKDLLYLERQLTTYLHQTIEDLLQGKEVNTDLIKQSIQHYTDGIVK